MDGLLNPAVGELYQLRGLLGDGLELQEYTGIHSWAKDTTRYTVVHPRAVAVLFVDTRAVDVIQFRHDLLGADGPKSYFTLPGKATTSPYVVRSGRAVHFCRP